MATVATGKATMTSTYAWDCREECGTEIIAVGIDPAGSLHLYDATCLTTTVEENPEIMISGTHILSTEALDDIYGTDR